MVNNYRGSGAEWYQYSREQKIELYEAHNGRNVLYSPDPNVRRFGRCGCPWCAKFRTEFNLATMPMNRQDRSTNSMGSINICDRCGSLVQGRAVGSVAITTSSDPATADEKTMEICPGCVADFMLMWETVVTPREKAYRQPYVEVKPETNTESAEQLAARLFEKLMIQAGKQEPKTIEG